MLIVVLSLAVLAEPLPPRAGPAPQPPPRAGEVRKARVVVRCMANFKTMRVRDCVVVSEDPPGKGFGQAAMNTAPMLKLPFKYKPAGGEREGLVVVPMTFDLDE
ncbi:MAG: hypothetical protein JWR84_4195 [Caulobacter sp.]|nr:hypothetical protein [Caulobacter sp.]